MKFSSWTVLVLNSTPMVVRLSCRNSFLVKRDRRLLFPTPDSPIKTTDEKHISLQVGQIFNTWSVKSKDKMSPMWKTMTRRHLLSNLTPAHDLKLVPRHTNVADLPGRWLWNERNGKSVPVYSVEVNGEARPDRIVRNTRAFVFSRRPKGKWFTAKWAGRGEKKRHFLLSVFLF